MTTGDWLGLDDRVCVVTGAGSGIGREVCLELVRCGARVAALDLAADGLADTAAEAGRLGAEIVTLTCDVSDPDGVARAAQTVVDVFGRCDVLVNNAGMTRPAPLAEISLADWQQPFAVNVTGALLCSQEFGRGMRERGSGSIVHTASICGTQPLGGAGGYSPSKSALLMMSRQLALEWGPDGVRSNVVSPGLVRTPMTEEQYRKPGFTEARAAVVPLGRVAEGADIASVVVFLASDRARYVSGQDLVVDAGLSQALMAGVPR